MKIRKKWTKCQVDQVIDLRKRRYSYLQISKIFNISPNAARKTVQRYKPKKKHIIQFSKEELINRIYNDPSLHYIHSEQIKKLYDHKIYYNYVQFVIYLNKLRYNKGLSPIKIY